MTDHAAAPRPRRILHLDMDAFYASVEQRDDPELRGRPVAVGGAPDKRGVVAAASYEARAFGVRSAIPMSRAVRLCPALVIVRPDFPKYRAGLAAGVRALPRGHAAGRAAVARRGLPRRHRERLERAARRRGGAATEDARFAKRTGLTASAGVAPNKFLAKIASGWQKPDGLTVIAPERVERFLQGLPVDALWGVGPVTAKKLQAHGITRLVDVRAADLETLRGLVGSLADWLKDLRRWPRHATGRTRSPVEVGRHRSAPTSTISRRWTKSAREIAEMAGDAAAWLERHGLYTRTVVIKVRYSDFETITRSHSAEPTRDADAHRRTRPGAARQDRCRRRPVRLLGASVHNLRTPRHPRFARPRTAAPAAFRRRAMTVT